MKVFVAGGSGAIGTQLVPILLAAGHEVTALRRSGHRIADEKVKVVTADALNAAELRRVVLNSRPEAIVNMLTSIPAELNPRRLSRDFQVTNQLRTEATRTLAHAAKEVGGAQLISQGLAYAYDPEGSVPASESDPLWRKPPAEFRPVLTALRTLEETTREANGLVLRLGHLYGPGTIYGVDGSFTQQVRRGAVPLVGGGHAVFSFTHTWDVASAVVAALDRKPTGALNIVDDEPAPMYEWLPYLASLLDAKPPRTVPRAMARLAVGGWGVAFMDRLRGADNARARLALDWRPGFTTWRDGFATELSAADQVPSPLQGSDRD